ncbi:hypothetical protein V8F20_001885, partial [Naviculisporaceae sp. PSN 640]
MLPRTLLPFVAVFWIGSDAADTCGRTITAKAGDSCLSLATAASITVAQFIRINPGIPACDNLGTGTRYCIDPTYVPSSSTSTSTSTRPTPSSALPLEVSKDGSCGNGFTCQGSEFGDCCSEHGWCGGTSDHCGPKCQAQFGLCASSGTGSSSSSPTPTSTGRPGGGATTVTETETKTVTNIRTVSV